ncbi:arf-GAP with dual PH domain-containing protein 1-like isoform X2 [Bolinopsis microptera]|uniref:arf-GAP with dual PH domain-containing protein 1-like isoform X2 n=1 Tax=Bolinopsis microptera TaxID=2820187 RepID=UPI003079D25C
MQSANTDKGQRIVENILKNPGNSCCVDCGALDCSWASTTLGCFVCIRCSGIHRNLGVHISRIKSVQLDRWTDSDCLNLERYGNIKVANTYGINKPEIYRHPNKDSSRMLIEHWIRAKYEWKEFHVETVQVPVYLKGVKSGTLLKKGKKRGCWLQRHFMLDRLDNTLSYYDTANSSGQNLLGQINLKNCYVLLTNDKIVEKPNCLHILFTKGNSMRSIYVCANSVREIIEWYYAIRSFQTQLGYARNCVDTAYESYLLKTPAEGKGSWKRRWCILVAGSILYYKNIMDPFPKGEVKISKDDKCEKLHNLPKHVKSGPDYVFTLSTKNRTYYWGVSAEETCAQWIKHIDSVQKDML